MKNNFLLIVGALCVGIFLAYQHDEYKKEKEQEANAPKEVIHCKLCGDDLTDNNNRINPTGAGYYCMDCYHKLNGNNSSDYSYSSSNNSSKGDTDSDYDEYIETFGEPVDDGVTVGSDGTVYANAPCELCGGSGFETNYNDRGEYVKSVCHACNGQGHIGY